MNPLKRRRPVRPCVDGKTHSPEDERFRENNLASPPHLRNGRGSESLPNDFVPYDDRESPT